MARLAWASPRVARTLIRGQGGLVNYAEHRITFWTGLHNRKQDIVELEPD